MLEVAAYSPDSLSSMKSVDEKSKRRPAVERADEQLGNTKSEVNSAHVAPPSMNEMRFA